MGQDTELVGIQKGYLCSVGGKRDMTEKPELPPAPLSDISIGEIKYLLRKLDLLKETNCEDFSARVSKEACENLCLPLTLL